MIINAICFTKNGIDVIARIKSGLGANTSGMSVNGYVKMDNADDSIDGYEKVQCDIYEFAKECFDKGYPLVVVGAIGIAVRMISPHVTDKLTDIPVIVVDELGMNVIPILSGHMGMANDIARLIAEVIDANPVITTATDINNTFSVDTFARNNNLTIANRDGIRKVSSKVLKGDRITISVKDYIEADEVDIAIGDASRNTNALIYLDRKQYAVGIGCKKDKSAGEIKTVLDEVLNSYKIAVSDIYAIGSVDIKKDEPGLLELTQVLRIPFVTFEASLLDKLEGDYTASDFVNRTVGIDNVCERAAMAIFAGRGELIARKIAKDGVTVAIARRQ